MSIENELFEQYKDVVEARDGIVNDEEWENLNSKIPKILFLLKETNGYDDDLRSFLKNGGRVQTWGNIARWSFLIKKMIAKNEVPKFEDFQKRSNECARKKHLSTACVVNLKKTAGTSTTKPNEFLDHFKNPKTIDLLKEQMKLYPQFDIIVCCGAIVFEIFRNKVLEEKELKTIKDFNVKNGNNCRNLKLYKSSKGYYIIDFIHPQQRTFTNENVWESLVDIVKEISHNK
jgi:hypothetical protein